MLKVIVSTLFMMSLAAVAMAQDPVKVDPDHYKVEFENSQVRVLRVKIGPGQKSIMHRHPDAVAIFMTDVNGRFGSPNGTSEDRATKAGEVRWTPAVVHLPENIGTEPFEVVLVELKARRPAPKASKAPATRSVPTNNN